MRVDVFELHIFHHIFLFINFSCDKEARILELATIMSFLKNIRFLLKSKKAKAAYVNQQVEAMQQKTGNVLQEGMFEFQHSGFYFNFKDGRSFIKWSDIIRIDAYKIDLITIDEIRLDIVLEKFQFTITEETPNWNLFIEKSKEVFTTIPKDWDRIITKPAFNANYITIYKVGSG